MNQDTIITFTSDIMLDCLPFKPGDRVRLTRLEDHQPDWLEDAEGVVYAVHLGPDPDLWRCTVMFDIPDRQGLFDADELSIHEDFGVTSINFDLLVKIG